LTPDPKLVITADDWDDMAPGLQAKTTYRTIISLREDVINLSKKVDMIANKPSTPCPEYEKRIVKLEKYKFAKTALTILSGFVGGLGGSHLPK